MTVTFPPDYGGEENLWPRALPSPPTWGNALGAWQDATVDVGLLGSVEVWHGAGFLDIGARQQRHVLAVLAADAGTLLMPETVIERVWDVPPRGARRTLHVHLSRIRQAIGVDPDSGGSSGVQLLSRSGGYLLDIDLNQVDVHRFRRLVDQSRTPHHGEHARINLLDGALRLWRGTPLTGLPGHWAERTRESWLQLYLRTAVAWARARLPFGDPTAVLERLSPLAQEHPMDEDLAATLMLALHAAGRPSEALAHFVQVRNILAEDLGTDPGAQLQRVHRQILLGEGVPTRPEEPTLAVGGTDRRENPGSRDPGGTAGMPAGTRPANTTPRPAQLPVDIAYFSGRADHLQRLTDLIDEHGTDPRRTLVIAITGTAGVGKTALALHWAHQVRSRFADGQLHVNLRGFDPGGRVLTPEEAVRNLLDGLGVEPRQVPATTDAQVALYRTLLSEQRMIIVLDNARDPVQVRSLLPGSARCVVVVTSRAPLTGLVATEGAHSVSLECLRPEESRRLLADRLGERALADTAALADIIGFCAGLPLALSITAARVLTRQGGGLGDLASQLRQARSHLDLLNTGDSDQAGDLRAVFSWSYATLSEPAARLFRLLSLHPGPDISAAAATSLAGYPQQRTLAALAELATARMLEESRPGRYSCHDLLRAYAADLADTLDSPADRAETAVRVFEHYITTATAGDRLMNPGRDPTGRPAVTVAPGVTPESLPDRERAISWFTRESQVMLGLVNLAQTMALPDHAWRLVWSLDTYLFYQGYRQHLTEVWQTALAAACQMDDALAEANAHRALARGECLRGHYEEARIHLDRALDLYARVGDDTGAALAELQYGAMWERRGDLAAAIGRTERALDRYQTLDHPRGLARCEANIGWYHILLGDHEAGVIRCERAFLLHKGVGDAFGQAATWDSLGYAYSHLGRFDRAVECFEGALAIFRELGAGQEEAEVLTHLGQAFQASGDRESARDALRRALEVLDALADPVADQVRIRLAAMSEL